MTIAVQLNDVDCSYGGFKAISDVSVGVESGELLTLLGPSGSGKTTLLRAIGGYITPTKGSIWIDDVDVTGWPPQRRNIGTVFQNYALFPHMRVAENVAFGLRARRVPKKEIRDRVGLALQLVKLEANADRYPHELSGGQQQRVALARAIVIEPDVLLMDEPLGALDLSLRESMQYEIRRVQQELRITTIYVTHDQNEAFALSDRIAIVNDGRIIEVNEPTALYRAPESLFTADFLGHANILRVEVSQIGPDVSKGVLDSLDHALVFPTQEGIELGERVSLMLRPDAVVVEPRHASSQLPGTVSAVTFRGMTTLLTMQIGAHAVIALDRGHGWAVGDEAALSWPVESVHVLHRASGEQSHLEPATLSEAGMEAT